MNITVWYEREQKTRKMVFFGKTVQDLLLQLKFNPETVLVTRKEEILTTDQRIKENDKIELLSVVSGG